MAKQDPEQWSSEKISNVESNLEGMKRKYSETGDPNLLKGIEKVETQLDIARGLHKPEVE